jgi:threonylcarbamoyladenosine tRNA methylthiotransferase MtaB
VTDRYLGASVFPILQGGSQCIDQADIFCSSIFASRELRAIADPTGGSRTRPVLKVQDGCSYRCSYCIIPSVRGNSRSLPVSEVIRQARGLLDRGVKEITLTGIHLGGYGRDFEDRSSLAKLVTLLLREQRLERLRLSSIEPLEFTDELIGLIAESSKMAKHFHVPLQSGSDRILRLMRRPYFADGYLRLVEKMRQYVPDAGIGSDVMVGFPTETEADHRATQKLLEAAPMTYLHVFPYSTRPGTDSARLKPEVPGDVAQQRSRDLRELAARKNLEFRSRFVGKRLSLITLDRYREDGSIEGVSSNYLKVRLPECQEGPNHLMDVVVTGLTSDGLLAEKSLDTPAICRPVEVGLFDQFSAAPAAIIAL